MTGVARPESHGKPYPTCGGRTRRGTLCERPAGWGTDHAGFGRCKLHLGSTGNHRKAAHREQLQDAARKLGVPKDVDVETAMLDLIREAAGNVDFYRSLVQELEQGRRMVGVEDLDDELAELDDEGNPRPRPSIAGRIKVDTLEAKPHVLVVLYNEERDRLQRYLKEAASLGIQQRKLDMAQDDARRIVSVLRGVIGDLDLPAEKMALLPGLVRRHMEAIAATAVELA